MEFFHLDPTSEDQGAQDKDYSKIVWVQLDQTSVKPDEPADKLAQRFNEFGDFNIYKDSQTSFFMEFYFIEADAVASQTIEELIAVFLKPEVAQKIGIKNVVQYKDAIKFKAHNRLE
jgi:hypothetical protein